MEKRKKNVAERLFSDNQPKSTSFGEIREFLDARGGLHKTYYHYTSLAPAITMLGKKYIFLTKGSELNDLQEFKTGNQDEWNRSYLACFSFGMLENIAMWKMYGGNDSKTSLRLGFSGKAFRRWLAGFRKAPAAFKVRGDGISPIKTAIEDVSLHDVAYLKGSALQWGRWLVTRNQLAEIQKAQSIPEMTTYVKDWGWAYEAEVRLVIRFEKPLKGVKTIAVDFTEGMNGMAIVKGPMFKYDALPDSVLSGIPSVKVVESEYAHKANI